MCPLCLAGYLEYHPELIYWKKCTTCAYSCIDPRLSEENKDKAKAKPFTRHPSWEAARQVEAEQKDRHKISLECQATSLAKEQNQAEAGRQRLVLQQEEDERNS